MVERTQTNNPAQTFEDYLVPNMFRPWADELIWRARPHAGERILDLACGTGIVARMIAEQLGNQVTITGLDRNPAMIEVAQSTAQREGASIEWHQGTAEELPFADASFDLVLIQQGLQFFSDKAAAMSETHRVLAPKGRVVSATWSSIANNSFFHTFAEVAERKLGVPALYAPYALGDLGTLRILFDEAGFQDVIIDAVRQTVRFSKPDRFITLTVAAAAAAIPDMQKMSEEERGAMINAVQEEMAGPVRQHTEGEELVFTMEAHIVRAHRN